MKSYIVKLNANKKYFKVEYHITTIVNVYFVSDKKDATIFQQGGDEIICQDGVSKISINKIRSSEFSFLLHRHAIKYGDITIEEIDAPIQPYLTDKELSEIKNEIDKVKNKFNNI
jgi:hypothetical protein